MESGTKPNFGKVSVGNHSHSVFKIVMAMPCQDCSMTTTLLENGRNLGWEWGLLIGGGRLLGCSLEENVVSAHQLPGYHERNSLFL